MLAIRLQRTGRSGHSQFRLIAQDSHFSPKRGRIVAYLGSYNPHTKEVKLDAEKVSKYLENGAQPSDTAAKLLKKEGIKLPAWFEAAQAKERAVRNPEKRRSTGPASAKAPAEKPAETEVSAEETASEEAAAEPASEETPAEPTPEAEPASEEPAAEPAPAPETSTEETESPAE